MVVTSATAHEDTRHRASISSRSSRLTLSSVHLIPSPGVEQERPPRYEPLILKTSVVMGLALLMITLAIALEVALAYSEHNMGFSVKEKNPLSFVPASVLTAFFPILLVAPIARLWSATDWAVRWYQPYVMLSKGNAKAEDTVLLDYMAYNKINALFLSLKRKHWLVHVSIITALGTNLVQPLAGAIFNLQQLPMPQPISLVSERAIGLSPDIATLTAFAAAAGYTDAAVFQSLPDPPFVRDGWAIAKFGYPAQVGTNTNLTVGTTAVLTSVNCENPTSTQLNLQDPLLYTFDVATAKGCSGGVAFNPYDSEQQYGVMPVNTTSCGLSEDLNVTAPVMFWFFHNTTDEGGQAKAVICGPQIGVYDVAVTVFLNNASVIDVQMNGNVSAPNNVTGSPLYGLAYNGVLFNDTKDPFISSRSLTVATGVPGSIFRFAAQTDPSLNSFFNSETGFLDITTQVYTQFLSVAAKSIYFVPENQTLLGQEIAMRQRLVIVSFPAHCLSVLFVITGIVGIAVHTIHRRQRRDLYLTAPPGSIAASMALAYHSGIGDYLIPYDDAPSMVRKLGMLHYGIDRRTGAIVAVEREEGGLYGLGDESEKTLLGRERASGGIQADRQSLHGHQGLD